MEKLTKREEFHRDLMHDIIETNKTYTVVQGIGDVIFIELTFIQTFAQRSRELALDQILDENTLDFF
jgi:hypothetical protein